MRVNVGAPAGKVNRKLLRIKEMTGEKVHVD